MLSDYFKRRTTLSSLYAGPAGNYLDEFSDRLAERGFHQKTVRHRIHGAVQFVHWARAINIELGSLTPSTMISYCRYLKKRGQLHYPSGNRTVRYHGARHFFDFLLATERCSFVSAEPILPELLIAFEQWMKVHRGVKHSTLLNYRHHLLDALKNLGNNPAEFTTAKLRTFILKGTRRGKIEVSKTRITAIRMFLRFLISTNRCESNLEHAIPSVAYWRLSTLPKYLPPEDIESVVDVYESTTELGARNKAIVLLLARLGLRAGEVAGLNIDDIDWQNGTLKVMGKNRREAKIPLPQDVGDALHYYLSSARPVVDSNRVFIRTVAPRKAITRYVPHYVAAQAIREAGIVAPSYGSHVLRHSAATCLLRQGSSLQVVGELLRHASIETTAHYAKVDTTLLQQVAKPWPGEASC